MNCGFFPADGAGSARLSFAAVGADHAAVRATDSDGARAIGAVTSADRLPSRSGVRGAGDARITNTIRVVLVEPQIAPNTGAIIRLCANTGAELHLVEPLGFELDDARLRRGGLDYHEYATVMTHPDIDAVLAQLSGRWFALSASGSRPYTDVEYRPDDVLVFGTERTGLHSDVKHHDRIDDLLTIPMMPDNRSLNLANAVSIVVYEAWRQSGFPGATVDSRTALAIEALHLSES